MKKSTNRRSDAYWKIYRSFILVLILPVLILPFISMKYDQNMFRSKILEQAEASLEQAFREMEQNLEEFERISMQGSLFSCMSRSNRSRDYRASEVIRVLSSYQVTHSILLECACYYEDMPEVIYTNKGTYSPQYYRKYKENGEWHELPDYLREMEKSGWITPDESTWELYPNEIYLQYVVQVPTEKSSWIFTVLEEELARSLEQENSYTVLYAGDGRQLYPFSGIQDELAEDSGQFYKIEAADADGAIRLVRYVNIDSLFAEANRLRMVFLAGLFFVMLLGGGMAAAFSSRYNKPIVELRKFCESKMDDIPHTLNGIDASRFVVRKIEEQMKELEERRKRENLMLQLIYGREYPEEPLTEQMHSLGMFRNADGYRVILMESESGGALPFDVDINPECLSVREDEIYTMRYASGKMEIGMAGVSEKSDMLLREKLEEAVSEIEELTGQKVVFFVGKKYRELNRIYLSYREALAARKNSQEPAAQSVVYYEERKAPEAEKFVYPYLELDSLYDAIVRADLEKAELITDMLLDSLLRQSGNLVVCSVLFGDILRTYHHALEKLGIRNAGLEELMDISNGYSPGGGKEMADRILLLRERVRAYLEMEKPDLAEDSVAAKVIAYINQNRNNRDLNASMVADYFHISASNLSHQIKAATGRNVSDYIAERKMIYAQELLRETDRSIQEIADMVGYSQTASFIRKFKKYFSMTPSEYRSASRRK